MSAPDAAPLPPEAFTDEAVLAREREALFRRAPVVVAHASELTAPGDHVTEWVAGMPVLVVRQEDGSLRAFLNLCPHQGAILVMAERGRGCAGFTCDKHMWRFRLDGEREPLPHEVALGGARPGTGLRPIGCVERGGLAWVQLEGGAPEVAGGPDLADVHVEHHASRTVMANWKRALEALLGRQGAQALGPGAVLLPQPGGSSLLVLAPMGVDMTRVVHRMLGPGAAADPLAAVRRDRAFGALDAALLDGGDPGAPAVERFRTAWRHALAPLRSP